MTRFPALLAVGLAGCSLLYNPNNLPNPPDEAGGVIVHDARPDADAPGDVGADAVADADADVAPPVDADDSKLELTDITPATINEGQGDSGSAPAVFVIRGHNIVNRNLLVEVLPPSGVTVQLAPVTDAVASTTNDYLAFTLTAHVDPALASDVALTVRVTQDVSPQFGGGTKTVVLPLPLTLHGLRELTSASPEVSGKVVTVSAAQPPAYSSINLTGLTPLTFKLTGTAKYAVLQAVSSIALAAVVGDAATSTAGPGGNVGAQTAGACPTVGGGGGLGGAGATLASGGGGGGGAGGTDPGASGAAGAGGLGAGGTGGLAGIRSGGDAMVALDANAACAGGAGGTGGLLSGNQGGMGGGGGGTIVLAAGGNIQVASISAKGGVGGAGVGGNSGGGGGGGGAGGNVLLRTDSGTLGTIGTIDVSAGGGGAPGGGVGAGGRIRWDAPAGSAPIPGARRGPGFARLASAVVTTPSPSLALVGTANDGFTFRVIDQAGTSHDGGHGSFTTAGATIAPALFPGYDQVCITLDSGAQGRLEADRCIEIVYLP